MIRLPRPSAMIARESPRLGRFWRARRDSNPRPTGSKPISHLESVFCSIAEYF